MPFFPAMPADASTKHIFTAHPEIYSHWPPVPEAILRGPSPLTPAQRELIGAYVSSLNSCQYCYGGHRAAAELFGIAPQTIDGLIQDLATAPIDSKLRPLLAFVKKLTLMPTRMTQADADAAFAAGGVGREGLAFRHRGLLPVQFHESARGRARDRGRSGRLRRARTQACRNGIRRPVRGGDGERHPLAASWSWPKRRAVRRARGRR